MTGRGDAAWPAGLAGPLAGIDEFLRSPAGHAAQADFCQARGSIAPGFDVGSLIDAAGITVLWLRGQAAPQAPRS